jgi:hypothetical protein
VDRVEIIMNEMSFDEDTLVRLQQRGQVSGETIGQHHGKKLAESVHETDRPEVFDLPSVQLLAQQDHESIVNQV